MFMINSSALTYTIIGKALAFSGHSCLVETLPYNWYVTPQDWHYGN